MIYGGQAVKYKSKQYFTTTNLPIRQARRTNCIFQEPFQAKGGTRESNIKNE